MTKTHVCIHADMCGRMPLKDTCTHSCMRAYTHMQDGMTALMLACAIKNEAAALLLMEATQKAGALDVQVNVVWSVCWEGGWAGGGGRGGEGGEEGHKVTKGWGGALTHACTCFHRAETKIARRCFFVWGWGWRARWRSCCRSAPMPHSRRRYGHART